jgi:hypothetical protein
MNCTLTREDQISTLWCTADFIPIETRAQYQPGYLWNKLRFGQSLRKRVLTPARYHYYDRGNPFFVGSASGSPLNT